MVPMLKRNVELLRRTYFSEPAQRMPLTLTVALPEGSDGSSIVNGRGNLMRISPEEGDWAFLLAVADRINQGADDGELELWKAMALNATVMFKIVPSSKMYFEALNLRRQFLMTYETLTRGCVQNIFALVDWKYEYEKTHGEISDKDVAAKYNAGLQKLEGVQEDGMSDYFVQYAIRSYNRILSVPKLYALVLEERSL